MQRGIMIQFSFTDSHWYETSTQQFRSQPDLLGFHWIQGGWYSLVNSWQSRDAQILMTDLNLLDGSEEERKVWLCIWDIEIQYTLFL